MRVLHGQEEGIVTKIIDNKTVEIEIEDGFNIPVLISELVLITKQEDNFFSDEIGLSESKQEVDHTADSGIFFSLRLTEPTETYILEIINNTDLEIIWTASKKEGKLKFSGISKGHLMDRSSAKITEFKQPILSSFNDLFIQVLIFNNTSGPIRSPIERHVKVVQLLSSKEMKEAPITGDMAWLTQIDEQSGTHDSKPSLNIELFDDPPSEEVDLHANALGIDENHTTESILQLQIDAFNKALDGAIVHGLKEIIFIHGVGQGTLKNRIVKEARSRKEVKYWQDAKKEKFGYGAIKIVL